MYNNHYTPYPKLQSTSWIDINLYFAFTSLNPATYKDEMGILSVFNL